MSQPIAMPKSAATSLLLVLAGAALFNAIFWHEKLALNMALFILFSVGAVFFIYKNAVQHRHARWMLLAVATSLAMVLVYNSTISCIACGASILLFSAYCKYQHRSPLYAAASAAQSFQYFIPQFAAHLKGFFAHKRKAATAFRQVRFALLPLLLVLLFFFIYLAANQAFASIASRLGNAIGRWLAPILDWVEPQRLLFLLLGLFITGGLLYKYFSAPFEKKEAAQNDDLQRLRKLRHRNHISTSQSIAQLFIGRHADSSLALKYEYKAGLWSLVVLNILLLAVNATDVAYVWLRQNYQPNFQWIEYVHSGAQVLVASIVLAIAVVLFFFRGNLNFLRSNKTLRLTAYLWLVQNAFLTLSVCLRNYSYVVYMGLAYKRIGLCVFLVLVFIGLFSVFVKIRWVKSNYYLIKFNAAASFIVLILSTFVQWDVLIARYNISHRATIPLDTAFLLRLSDPALPILQQHPELFQTQYVSVRGEVLAEKEDGPATTFLEYRIHTFLSQQKQLSWLSWNWADAQTRQQLQGTVPLAAVQK